MIALDPALCPGLTPFAPHTASFCITAGGGSCGGSWGDPGGSGSFSGDPTRFDIVKMGDPVRPLTPFIILKRGVGASGAGVPTQPASIHPGRSLLLEIYSPVVPSFEAGIICFLHPAYSPAASSLVAVQIGPDIGFSNETATRPRLTQTGASCSFIWECGFFSFRNMTPARDPKQRLYLFIVGALVGNQLTS